MPLLIELEPQLQEAARPFVREVLELPSATLFRVMQLPKPLLYDLWQTVFETCKAQARTAMEQGRDVFITFHATWYHHQNREYISAVDFVQLTASDLKGDAVVTLIDDAYDTLDRLSEPDGLFYEHVDDALTELEDRVLKLLLILDWRTTEQLVSEKIAAVMQCPHFVLAVKHPCSTLQSLLRSESKRTYLSHPITEPRNALRSNESDGRRMIEDIQATARYLRMRTTLFEPTCIDELRLDYVIEHDGRSLVLPLLSERWPLPEQREEELLFVRPSTRDYPFGQDAKQKAEEALQAYSESREIPHLDLLLAAAALLQVLRSTVYRHVNLRDHKLIDQSDALAVYRPYPNGRETGGVKEELQYHDRLRRSGKVERLTVVLHPSGDETQRPREELRRHLRDLTEDEHAISGAASAVQAGWPQTEMDPLAVGRSIRDLARSAGIALPIRRSRSALRREGASEDEQALEERGEQFLEQLERYVDRLDPSGLDLIEDELSPAEFVERVMASLDRGQEGS